MDLIAGRLERLWKKLREGKKKRDCRMKTANLLVRDAFRIRGVIVFERESREII
jgi:hypothetical protein